MPAFFGLDIGSAAIKIVQLSGRSAVAVGMAVNPTGRVGVDLIPAEEAALTKAIKDLIAQLKIKSKKVVVSVPEALVYTKVMQFPFMSTPELATAIKWEAEQSIPYPIEKLEVSWVVLYKPKSGLSGEKMKVLVVGVPGKVSNAYVNLLESLNLETLRIENEILSAIRGLISLKKLAGVSLIIDIGHSATKMVIADKNELYSNYVSPLGGGAFTKIIADSFKMNLTQAEEYKRSYGLDKTQLEGKIVAACEPVTNGLLADIKKVMVAYEGLGLSRAVDRAILVGGGSYLKGLFPLLTAQVGVEVTVGNVFEGLKVAENLRSLGTVYANATGLAVEEE